MQSEYAALRFDPGLVERRQGIVSIDLSLIRFEFDLANLINRPHTRSEKFQEMAIGVAKINAFTTGWPRESAFDQDSGGEKALRPRFQ